MPEWVRWLGFVVGVLIFIATCGSVMRALIVPRGLWSKLLAGVGKVVRKGFLLIANRFDTYDAKDRILALVAPLSLLLLLVAWLALFFVAYALMLYPLADITFPEALRESGSAMLTLGFAAPPTVSATIVHMLAAATGLIVVALQIAYLPTLYSAFNRRETLVTMLQSRAGSPAWGPEILARHQLVGLLDDLPNFYGEWERWAADVAESHTNYITLLWFRSPHPLRSWLVGLLAVMDSGALYHSLCPTRAPAQVRLCIRMGFTCLRNIASTIGLPHDPDPMPDDPIELTFEEFQGAVDRLAAVDFPMERTAEEAWPHFRGWRVNYEAVAYLLADLIVAPPGPWSGPRRHLPDLAIVPQRPADRKPQDPMESVPRAKKGEWRA